MWAGALPVQSSPRDPSACPAPCDWESVFLSVCLFRHVCLDISLA